MLPHAFVVARILPAQSSSQASVYGSAAAGKFKTRPFLALRIHLHPETGFYAASSQLSPKGLFVVSPYKPVAPFEDFYLPLTPGDRKKALKLNRPLPCDEITLYIHTYPLLREHRKDFDDSTNTPIKPSFYQLDDESYHRLITFYRDLLPPSTQIRSSGGPEYVQPGWATFSGQHMYEGEERPGGSYVVHLSPFTGTPLHDVADIRMESVVLKRLQEDYSWNGVNRTINWLCGLRSWSGFIQPYLGCARRPNSGDVPLLLEESFQALVLPTAADVEPKPMRAQLGDATGDSDDSDSSDDGWFPARPKFATVVLRPTMMTGASESGIRAVVFDICGAIVDFSSCSRDALLQLGLPEAGIDQWVVLLRELQALEGNSSSSPFIEVARRALHTVARSLPWISRMQFEAAVRTLTSPRLIPGIKDALIALHEAGYAIFGYSTLDAAMFEVLARPLVSALPLCVLPVFNNGAPGLFSPCTQSHMQLIRKHICLPGTLPEQILVVSPSSVRLLEPAAAAGMATALLAIPGHPEVDALKEHASVKSNMVVHPHDLATLIRTPANWKRSEPLLRRGIVQRVHNVYELGDTLQRSPSGVTVCEGITWSANELVAIKYELVPDGNRARSAVGYEARVYTHLAGCFTIPCVHWFGFEGGADVLVMDLLGPTLEDLRLACRGTLSLKTVLMIGIQMIDFVEFVHSRGLVLRDIKPQNSAVGRAPELAGTIYNFDFGNAKTYIDPRSGTHIPLRSGRKITGTVRFCSHWAHQGLESGRRDDIAVLGHTLLYLLHGHLPWQGIYAPSRDAKLQRIGEMKDPRHPALVTLLAHAPTALSGLMSHAYALDFAQKPDYTVLRGLLDYEMAMHGWFNDGLFDWVHPELTARGTLVPSEYKFYFEPDSIPPSIGPFFNSSGEMYMD